MSPRTLTTALTLYRSQTLGLADAAAYTGISTDKMASALASRGISVREEDEHTLTTRAAN